MSGASIARSRSVGYTRAMWVRSAGESPVSTAVRVVVSAVAGGVLAVLAVLAVLSVGCDGPSLDQLSPPRLPERIDTPSRNVVPGRPNLVLISIDTLRADRLSAYGHDRPTSPRIDRLAADGVLFENAFSHSPKTASSHMSLMTGLYPESHRVQNRQNGA